MRKLMLATLLALAMPAIAVAVPGVAGAEVTRAPGAAQAPVELTYTEPDRDGQRITWHWTVTNQESAAADVVITHRVTPTVPVMLTAPCEGTAEKITCRLGEVPAGGQIEGTIVAELPPGQSDTPQVQGKVTWRDAPATP